MNKTKFLFIITIIDTFAIIILTIFLIIGNVNKKDSVNVFKKNINNIVEVKASTDGYGESYGSGIVYDEEGYVLTNYHVISYTHLGEKTLFENIEIRFQIKEEYQSASFVKYDEDNDIALIKINEEKKYDTITFSKDEYESGDRVYAIGNTSNYGIGISEGIISVKEVYVSYEDKQRLVIQADINIASGNSGGALLDSKGNLIGITSFRTKDLYGNVNYGFTYSIPLKIIKEFIKGE